MLSEIEIQHQSCEIRCLYVAPLFHYGIEYKLRCNIVAGRVSGGLIGDANLQSIRLAISPSLRKQFNCKSYAIERTLLHFQLRID